MRRLINTLCIVCSLYLTGCDDVFVEDISDDTITIMAPVNESRLSGNAVQFRWTTLEGADNYHIQIIGDQQNIVLDSLVEVSIFNYQIDPGAYQWRVRAENFAYVTPYTPISLFTINASDNLTNQLVTLVSPNNNVYLNADAITFSWQGITTADSYHFQLLKKDGASETQIFEDTEVVDTSLNLTESTIEDDAEYIWQVKAQNSASSTSFFKRSFFIDRQAPPAPSLNGPADDAVFNVDDEVEFDWAFTDTGDLQSPISGTIEIASDENFNTIVASNTGTSTEFTTTFSNSGTYHWRVTGEDEAGNTGAKSDSKSITVN
nr:hypothetical protein [Allomuricauda sp.]